ncbi:MAG: Rrf2 family transcriptional regulator [Clostridiaceae bacterium]|nr:Rrf2 family transcriptional regulator [Clostridiaceae bacterium]
MKISTKGRYALRLMLDLAMSPGDEYITIKSIAARQNISDKYLEQIITVLSRAGYVKSTRGAQGGYKLAHPADTYTVGMILRLIEGNLAPVACMEDDPNQCPRCADCVTLDVWKQVGDAINQVVDHITLADLLKKQLIRQEAAKV